ncbi:MAG TPA: hypothetical protein HPP66_01890 [Planctomycetes bacterium]|nr:hypothetical protein [Planctomycetota bacterium]
MKNLRKSTILKFDDAFEIVMSSISGRPLGTERVEIERALNRVLAEDVSSDIDIPPMKNPAASRRECSSSND